MNLEQMLEPFPAEHIEWRVQQAGEKNGKIWAKVLAYVTNRAIMARLDEVCGPENWKNEYRPGPEGGIVCGISVYIDQRGEWVTKWDGAENTDVEAVKGGLSGAMKRAAVQWGIGRYLYDLEEGWAKVHDGGQFSAKTKDNKWYKWDPPALPAWALPSGAVVRSRNGNEQRVVTTPQIADRLRDLAKQTDPDTAAEVEKKIAAGIDVGAATKLAAELKNLAKAGAA